MLQIAISQSIKTMAHNMTYLIIYNMTGYSDSELVIDTWISQIHSISNKYPTMYHFVTKMCTQCTFLLQNGALLNKAQMHCGICSKGNTRRIFFFFSFFFNCDVIIAYCNLMRMIPSDKWPTLKNMVMYHTIIAHGIMLLWLVSPRNMIITTKI